MILLPRITIGLLLTLSVCVAGCANWSGVEPTNGKPLTFPKTRLAPNSVSVEIAVAQLDADQQAQTEEFWRSLDQQELPLEVRKRLDRYGLRVGVMSTRMPAVLQDLLKPSLPAMSTLDAVAKEMALAGRLEPVSRLLLHQRISNENAEVYPIGTSDLYDSLQWSVVDGQQEVSRLTNSVQAYFDLVTFHQSDASVQVKLRPVLRHGNERPRIGVADSSFVIDYQQSEIPLDELAFTMDLRVGETLVVSATKPHNAGGSPGQSAALGRQLFGSTQTPDSDRLLLIRLVQTQGDDLFEGRGRASQH